MVADPDRVAVVQHRPSVDSDTVDLGAVAAVQILDEELAGLDHNLGVVPADGAVIKDDLRTGMASQNGPLGVQGHNQPRRGSLGDFEKSHDHNFPNGERKENQSPATMVGNGTANFQQMLPNALTGSNSETRM